MLTLLWLRQLRHRWFGRRLVRRAPVRRRVCLRLEALEDRLTPSPYIVTTDADSGAGSLREAITQAMAGSQPAVINFDSSLAGDTIKLTTTDSDDTPYGPTALVINNANITIDAANAPGLVLDGGGKLRLFAVTNTASLTLDNLTVQGGLAQGGAGGNAGPGGGGGGAGLGGAIYDDGGAFTAEGVTFLKNTPKAGRVVLSTVAPMTIQAAGAAVWTSQEKVALTAEMAAVAAGTAVASTPPAPSTAVRAASAAAVATVPATARAARAASAAAAAAATLATTVAAASVVERATVAAVAAAAWAAHSSATAARSR